ncbi:MAG: tetratricopeptide repeat protein [Leptolyngbyaceae bacterium]|nr:tetratricopeptide repeat protein [Leptolyngbyaceae bacterium]
MKKQIRMGCLVSLLWVVSLGLQSGSTQAEDAYQRWIKLAEEARQKGDLRTALLNYGRAEQAQPNDVTVNQAVENLLRERLQNLQQSAPKYVALIQKADAAYFGGDYQQAIAHYQQALTESPGDYYATIRIQQAQCIQTKRPLTGRQFRAVCPSLFPPE